MTRISTFDDIERLYAVRGDLNYGEGVTQMEHAVQCAALAEAEGARPGLIVAALLHDIGHLLTGEDDLAQIGVDDRHEAAGARALGQLFGSEVVEPIALHVAAKRYLCMREPTYLGALSAASQRSLALQGGVFDASEAAAFERHPHWREAVALRRFDDSGKQAEFSTRLFEDFAPLVRTLLQVTPPLSKAAKGESRLSAQHHFLS